MKLLATQVVELRHIEGRQVVGFGLPLEKSAVFQASALRLVQANNALPAAFDVRSRWPDGSVRWLWCEVLADQGGNLDLAIAEEDAGSQSACQTVANPSANAKVLLQRDQWAMALTLGTQGCPLQIGATIKIKDDHEIRYLQDLALQQHHTDHASHLTLTGQFPWQNTHLNFYCQVLIYPLTGEWRLTTRIHNPNAAAHPGGCWDLGDPNSAFIENFSLLLQLPGSQASCRVAEQRSDVEAVKPAIEFVGDLDLAQTGSGGDHWQSPAHWDEHKQSTVNHNGFTVSQNDQPVHQGMRAQPVIALANQHHTLVIKPQDFWQNFPATLTLRQDVLQIQLFPQRTELQGGESKTWQFAGLIQSGDQSSQALCQLADRPETTVKYDPAYINRCQVLPHLQLSSHQTPIKRIIRGAIEGDDTFFAKRERIDEYGWRHYGDLYADHETHGLPKQPYFISHYNNQYDPLLGMTLQYLQDGNERWLDLVHPLNLHVQDIDIYDTRLDRAEYSGGLFWHTNHYLPAETCTHRSYSRHHVAAYQDYSAGGGPGGQHCYTTGLALQYWLFGDERAKQKVIQLCDWIRCFYNGDGTLLDRLYRFLTIDIKDNQFTNIGIKAPGFRYPLDRGTGNYLIALMDAFDLTGTPAYLDEAGYVIRNTVHPAEDIALRHLDDVENRWFYTVFLQAVCRYIASCNALGKEDKDYRYACASLRHFGQWMLGNDKRYLDTPDKLEFPNHTWAAQEIRKASLFQCISLLLSSQPEHHQQAYRQQSEQINDYIAGVMEGSDERHFVRIVCLLMQSCDWVGNELLSSSAGDVQESYSVPPPVNAWTNLRILLNDLFRRAGAISLKRELAWLKFRL